MIIFLGITLLVYYLKPHETSMFIRLHKETVSDEEKDSDIIHKLIRSEYIRRGEAFPVEILEREMIKATKLSKQKVYSVVEKLSRENIDIKLVDKKDDMGLVRKYLDFVSVTEKFDRKGVAQKKAKKYLSERLLKTMTKREKTLNLEGSSNSQGEANHFLNSLSTNYTKKQHDEKKIQEQQKDTIISFTRKNIPSTLRNNIIDILKKEYRYRIEHDDKYPDFRYSISEIASEIQSATRITVGELYPILETISYDDIEISNCYATGAVSGTFSTGGLVGSNNSATISNCFYDQETSGQSDTGNGDPKTTGEMKEQGTFTGWDFTGTWGMGGGINDGYPYLLGNE